jgi:hypothetical protein
MWFQANWAKKAMLSIAGRIDSIKGRDLPDGCRCRAAGKNSGPPPATRWGRG